MVGHPMLRRAELRLVVLRSDFPKELTRISMTICVQPMDSRYNALQCQTVSDRTPTISTYRAGFRGQGENLLTVEVSESAIVQLHTSLPCTGATRIQVAD